MHFDSGFLALLLPVLGYIGRMLWKIHKALVDLGGYRQEHDAMWTSHAEFARIDPALYRPERKERARR